MPHKENHDDAGNTKKSKIHRKLPQRKSHHLANDGNIDVVKEKHQKFKEKKNSQLGKSDEIINNDVDVNSRFNDASRLIRSTLLSNELSWSTQIEENSDDVVNSHESRKRKTNHMTKQKCKLIKKSEKIETEKRKYTYEAISSDEDNSLTKEESITISNITETDKSKEVNIKMMSNKSMEEVIVSQGQAATYEHIEEYEFIRSKFVSGNMNSEHNSHYDHMSHTSSSESFGSSISSSRNPRKKLTKRSQSKENRSSSLPNNETLEFSPLNDVEIISDKELMDTRPLYFPATQGCRLVEEFECLNKIEEGTYGVVFRARDRKSEEIVALKRLKMEKERDGFPITSLREINTLMKARHVNVVTVREVVVGSNMDKIYLVMDFIEHDLKSLMQSMVKPFEICEVKCLLLQLLRAVAHLHDNWILHRDLKTSNLLLSHKGILKVADFGLAREYGSPLKNYTRLVVTLWYRAPELLLGTRTYSTQIDMWSVGCIFGEFILMSALFPGKNEANQIDLLFRELGTPNDKIWPGYSNLPNVKRFDFGRYEFNRLSKKFGHSLSECGLELINRLLAYCPDRRISAEDALAHPYFNESPIPISHEMFPIRPAKSEGGVLPTLKHLNSPKPPSGGEILQRLNDDCFLIQ